MYVSANWLNAVIIVLNCVVFIYSVLCVFLFSLNNGTVSVREKRINQDKSKQNNVHNKNKMNQWNIRQRNNRDINEMKAGSWKSVKLIIILLDW